jgi:guanylate kinase
MSSDGAQRAPPGVLLVLSAPSGAGKTTLAHRYRDTHPDALFSVSATTRAPRGGERDGADYHFVTPDRFASLVSAGAFAEWAEVHGRYYGTLRSTVDEALRRRQVAIFDIDVQGGEQIKKAYPRDACTVLVLPPDVAELERRLRGRGTDAEEVIRGRLEAAQTETTRGLATYEYVVINDALDEAVERVAAIVRHARARLGGGVADPVTTRIAEACLRGVASTGGWSPPKKENPQTP